MPYVAPVKDMLFVMNQLAGLSDVVAYPAYSEAGVDVDLAPAILEESAKFNQDVIAPLNWTGDQHPSSFLEMVNSANLLFALCPLLTDGAIEALLTAASPELQEQYVPKMISGE